MVAIGEKTVNTNVHEGRCVNARPTRRESLSDDLNAALEMGDQPTLVHELQLQIAALDAQPPRLLDAAVKYASWGWPVFPLAPGTKRPALPNAHPEGDPLRGVCKGGCGRVGHGVHDATTDVDRLRRYWTEKNPTANIGLATGFLFDVIDVDPPKKEGDPDGMLQVPKILESEKIPDAHGVVITRTGGIHYYIKAAGKGNRAGILPGVDYRGKGGYVVAPPSRIDADHRWFWSVAASPEIHL